MKLKHILTEADVFDTSNSDPTTAIIGALDDIGKEFKSIDLEPKKVNEALGLTLAGVALSMPEIIKLIGKFLNILKRIPGLKSLSGDRLITLGDKMHGKLITGITYGLSKAGVKDPVKAKKFANILLHVVIAMLLIAGSVSLSELVSKGNVSGATLKGALNAIKTKELRSFIISSAEAIA